MFKPTKNPLIQPLKKPTASESKIQPLCNFWATANSWKLWTSTTFQPRYHLHWLGRRKKSNLRKTPTRPKAKRCEMRLLANCSGKIGTGRGRSLGPAFCINIRATISNFSAAHIFLPSLRGDPVSGYSFCIFYLGPRKLARESQFPFPFSFSFSFWISVVVCAAHQTKQPKW